VKIRRWLAPITTAALRFGMNIAAEDGKAELKRKTPDGQSEGIHLR
jgi:hypothetical protein